MKTSAVGRAVLAQREGVRLKAYRDSVGVWTIGVGHSAKAPTPPTVTAGMVISPAQADAILAADLAVFEAAVNGAVRVELTQNQFDACISLAFNIGTGGFAKSTVVRRINAGQFGSAADAFLLWNKPAVLTSRREAERVQFLTPYETALPRATAASKPVPPPVFQAEQTAVSAAPKPIQTQSWFGWLKRVLGRM